MHQVYVITEIKKSSQWVYNIITKGERISHKTSERVKKMKMVINKNGKEINYDAAVMMMDDEIREEIANAGDCETEQEFFTAYEKAHEEAYGEEWELSKSNSVW